MIFYNELKQLQNCRALAAQIAAVFYFKIIKNNFHRSYILRITYYMILPDCNPDFNYSNCCMKGCEYRYDSDIKLFC